MSGYSCKSSFFFGLFSTVLLFTANSFAQQTQDRKLVEASLGVNLHTYHSDKNDRFQLGAPSVEPAFNGFVGLTKSNQPFGGGFAGAYNQRITTGALPAPVLLAMNEQGIPQNNFSLRLQYAWQVGGGVYLAKDLLVGYRFARDTWRYDDISRPARTTIPYIRSKQHSHIAIARYAPTIKRFHFHLESGVGHASLNFVTGEERNLRNNDEGSIAKVSGFVVPTSVGTGVRVTEIGETAAILPFVRFDRSITKVSGLRVTNQNVYFGVKFVF